MPLSLPEEAEVYGDAAYTDYQAKDDLRDTDRLVLQIARKRNSTRPDSPALAYIEQTTRHYIATVFK